MELIDNRKELLFFHWVEKQKNIFNPIGLIFASKVRMLQLASFLGESAPNNIYIKCGKAYSRRRDYRSSCMRFNIASGHYSFDLYCVDLNTNTTSITVGGNILSRKEFITINNNKYDLINKFTGGLDIKIKTLFTGHDQIKLDFDTSQLSNNHFCIFIKNKQMYLQLLDLSKKVFISKKIKNNYKLLKIIKFLSIDDTECILDFTAKDTHLIIHCGQLNCIHLKNYIKYYGSDDSEDSS